MSDLQKLIDNVERIIIGKTEAIKLAITCLLALLRSRGGGFDLPGVAMAYSCPWNFK